MRIIIPSFQRLIRVLVFIEKEQNFEILKLVKINLSREK